MIITCPSCSTRFQIADNALGPAGRKVRCAKCGENWWQDPAPIEAEAPLPAPEPADSPPEVPAIPERPREIRTPGVQWPEIRSEPPPWQLSDRGIRNGWILLGVFLLALVTGVLTAQGTLTGVWPESRRLYAALGMEPDAVAPVFDMRETRARWEENGTVLLIEGRLVNLTEADQPYPEVRLVLRDASGAVIAAIPMRPGDGSPAPETVAPEDGQIIRGEFVGVPETAVEAGVFISPATISSQPG